MNDKSLCPKCHGEMDEGRLSGQFWYTPDNAKVNFFSLGAEVQLTRARACLDCGYVETYIDKETLRRKLGIISK